MGAASRPLRKRRRLLVEGKDDRAIVQSLCAVHTLPAVFEVVVKQNVHELLEKFFVELREPGVERVGIVVDANGSAAARWHSISYTLRAEGYPEVPDKLGPDGMLIDARPKRKQIDSRRAAETQRTSSCSLRLRGSA